jgi:hypothetical protein
MITSPASTAMAAIAKAGFIQNLLAVSMTILLLTVAGALLPNTSES